ncbi:MAG: hypothetical protein M3548_18820 [Actinomycetota bacterium]|nr:hypothetical protein [Actinomycetota bacterium]
MVAKRLWMFALAGGLALVGAGVVVFVVVGLDRADKLASVTGVFVGLAGLAVAVYGVMLARRGSAAAGQVVGSSTVGGGVTQVRGVKGAVRIGPVTPSAPSAPNLPSSAPSASPGDQSVTGTRTSGPVRQVDDVGGDVDINR